MKPPSESQYTRRSFLITSTAPLSALLLQSCSVSRTASISDTRLPSSFKAVQSDHPLSSLRFINQGIVSSALNIERTDTPVLFSEGSHEWHVKGIHPYAHEIPSGARITPEEDAFQLQSAPPVGIRSAPSLGGLGTGTLELKTDGSLSDWLIFNNSPGNGEPKVHIPGAFFGIRTGYPYGGASEALTFRTHPPENLPAIHHIAGSGGFPVTRLSFSDSSLPLAVELYAYGAFSLDDPLRSSTPAVVFSFLLSNPTPDKIETALMFNMPNIIEGTFRTERNLILSRSGDTATAGEISMGFYSGAPTSSIVAPDLEDIWDNFAKTGLFEKKPALGLFNHGAISTSFIMEPGTSRTASFILSWNFPNRDIAGQRVGNFYAKRSRTASSTSEELARTLPSVWESMQSWQTLCLDNSLPSPIQDALQNSMSQLYRTTFCTANGQWRHWDSFANPTVSSLQLQLYRAFPLLFFYPSILKDQLRAFATHQNTKGAFAESLGMGARSLLDSSQEAHCDTKNPLLFLLAHLYYTHTADRAFLQELWPHIQKAVAWQLSITTPQGLPSNLPRLGDWQSINTEGLELTDALFHLAGLTAVLRMAETLGKTSSVSHLQPIIKQGYSTFEDVFWENRRYTEQTRISSSLEQTYSLPHRDRLLGFIWPLLAGMDHLVERDRLDQHLQYIADQESSSISIRLRKDSTNSTSSPPLYPATAITWAALHILVNNDIPKALGTLSDLLNRQNSATKDLWGHYEQILHDAGSPWANPHHASHLSIWFIPLSLNGQFFDAVSSRLQFNPRISNRFRLPFFTPQAHGMLTRERSGTYLLEVLSGRLEVQHLEITPGIHYQDVFLESGQSLILKG